MSQNATKVDVTFYDNYVPSIKDGAYTLTVTLGGNGSGSVSSAPTGISCGADCTLDVRLKMTKLHINWAVARCDHTSKPLRIGTFKLF